MSIHSRRRLSRWLPTFVALAVALPALAQLEVRRPTGPPPVDMQRMSGIVRLRIRQ